MTDKVRVLKELTDELAFFFFSVCVGINWAEILGVHSQRGNMSVK